MSKFFNFKIIGFMDKGKRENKHIQKHADINSGMWMSINFMEMLCG